MQHQAGKDLKVQASQDLRQPPVVASKEQLLLSESCDDLYAATSLSAFANVL